MNRKVLPLGCSPQPFAAENRRLPVACPFRLPQPALASTLHTSTRIKHKLVLCVSITVLVVMFL